LFRTNIDAGDVIARSGCSQADTLRAGEMRDYKIPSFIGDSDNPSRLDANHGAGHGSVVRSHYAGDARRRSRGMNSNDSAKHNPDNQDAVYLGTFESNAHGG
jgi:hypothetical protein